MRRLAPDRVTVLGGEQVVFGSVERELSSLGVGEVRRWAGDDRFATAAAVASEQFPDGADTVYVATGASLLMRWRVRR